MDFLISKNELSVFSNALASYGSRFHGLGLGSAYLAHLLVLRADLTTGMVEGISYRDLTLMMSVDHAPGRRNAGIPKITRVRSYAQSIALALPEDFEVISEGQSLKMRFKTLPAFIKTFFAQKQDNRDTGRQYENTYVSEKQVKNTDYHTYSETAFSGEASRVEDSNINSYNCNITKLTHTGVVRNSLKQPIAPDFFPSDDTIQKAQSMGYGKVIDLAEIQAFIAYNQKYGSTFEDFNPVYLRWLQRGVEHEQKQQAREALKAERLSTQQKQNNIAYGEHDVARKPAKTRSPSYDELMAILTENHQRLIATQGIRTRPTFEDFEAAIDADIAAFEALAHTERTVQPPLYAKTWPLAERALA